MFAFICSPPGENPIVEVRGAVHHGRLREEDTNRARSAHICVVFLQPSAGWPGILAGHNDASACAFAAQRRDPEQTANHSQRMSLKVSPPGDAKENARSSK